MPTSGVEENAMRLLIAFHKLSGGKPTDPVFLGRAESPPNEGAANAAGLDFGSTELDVALRYLLDGGYLDVADEPDYYKITVPGIDQVRAEPGGA
jgi:hypothetical protein